ncbi:hypothetical protein [Edaphobacter modestus]|uniref:Uncharacterized protein n=1 Tax=Edaphobacter modestus TaxID=388466 RepID=A0A4Q7YWV0_9BACT|nr:hypothetical protein [Edaphobacter modestus]RZU41874.1 hypothetical protein BDD14_3411 [Edaphobacter modestus]
MPRTLPMLALIALSASTFSYGQGSNTRYTIVKLKAPAPVTPPPSTPTTPPATTPTEPTTPPTTTPTEPTTPPATPPTEPTSPPTTTPTEPTTPPATTPTPSACSVMDLGAGANLNGFVPFQANSAWRQNVANAPVDGNSGNLINFIGGSSLRANFGSGTYDGNIIGIPYTVVSGSPFTTINYNLYGDESDPGPMPISTSTLIEGAPNPGDGDRHVLVLDRDNCWLYEIGAASPQGDGTWQAAAGAVWDMLNENARPFRWTSTDAAGLPVFPGLVRYDEVAAGHIDHAIRVTLSRSRQAFVAPASHWAPNSSDPNAAPMGMRMRLKANFDISSFPPQAKVILTALKNYGLINADNGSNMFMIGAPDDRWNNDDLNSLKQVPASAFEVVQSGTVYTPSNVPSGSAPNITSFTADNATVSAGTAVTLSWAADNASYYIVSPEAGAVRGHSVTVHPTTTTTYTLYATNQFDRSSKTITITVQ